jgi:hypothetical protein
MSRKIAALDELDDYIVKIEGWDCEKQTPSASADKGRTFTERDVTDDLTSGQIALSPS